MPLIALIVGILLVFVIHRLVVGSNKGSSLARWILGGGMIVTLFLASRVFGGRILYAFIPAIQAWMVGGGKGKARTETHASTLAKTGMSREEAALILGVEAGASEAQVKAAYKKLMKKLHPDQGGNDYLASKLNAAKDTLMG
ncbi:MAG: DnaJ domain-containing protein [Rickettsiales bacterium]|nr:DnaJ domain-containing protein [Rickettsiales bacterium]